MTEENRTLKLVTETEAARILAVSTAALRRWRRERRGPEFVHVERCVRYSVQAIESYLAGNVSRSAQSADSQSAPKREVRRAHATTRPS